MRSHLTTFTACTLAALFAVQANADDKAAAPIKPEAVNLGRPVDFERDVIPILDANCIACHNIAIDESKLILEDVKSILKGGKRGPAVVAKDPDKSLMYQVAARAKTPHMPPMPNEVDADPLSPKQLGVLRQWILEGAAAGAGASNSVVNWQPLPTELHSIFSVALDDQARLAAAGRSNRIVIYDVLAGREVARLVDPALAALQHDGKPMYPLGAAHRDFVHALAFSPDGNTLASAGYRVVKLWQREANVQKAKLASASPLTAAAVSPDQKILATGAEDGKIQIAGVADGKVLHTITAHTQAVRDLKFSPDGTKLFSSGLDGAIRIWNTADAKPLGRIDAPAAVNAITLSKDAAQIVSGGGDNFIRVWNTPTAEPRQLAAAAAPYTTMTVSADGKTIALGQTDGVIIVLEAATGKTLQTLKGHTAAVRSLSFSADAKRLASACDDKTARIWDVTAGTTTTVLERGDAALAAVALRPDATQAVTAAADNSLTQWTLNLPASRKFEGDDGAPVKVAAASRDGKLLATAGVSGGKPAIFIRDVATGKVTKTIPAHDAAITALAFSLDNTKIASGSEDKTARVWSIADGKELAKFAGHTAAVRGVAFNSNAQQVVSGADDKTLKLWNVADAKELKDFAGHEGPVAAVLMTPDNKFVISAGDKTLRAWNPADGKQVRVFYNEKPVTTAALSPDGQRVAVGINDGRVRIYQTADGKQLADAALHKAAVRSIAFSTDNARLVSTGDDQRVAIVSAADGVLQETTTPGGNTTFVAFAPAREYVYGLEDKTIHTEQARFERAIAGLTKPATDAIFHPNGSMLYVSSEDGTVRGFRTDNGVQAFAANHGAVVHDLDLSPNGAYLASAGENKQIRVWNASNGGNGPKPTLAGFTAAVKSVAFSRDNTRVIGGAADGNALVFNLADGLPEQAFASQTGAITAVGSLGDKGEQVVSVADDKTVQAWSLAAVRKIAGHSKPVTSLELLSPAGTQFVSAGEDGTARIWNLSNGVAVRSINHGVALADVAASPDGQFIVTAATNGTARMWQVNNGQQKFEVRGSQATAREAIRLTDEKTVADQKFNLATVAQMAADKNQKDRDAALKTATDARAAAEKAVADPTKKLADATTELATATAELAKKPEDKGLQKKVADATKKKTDAEAALKKATDAFAASNRALELAKKAVESAKVRLAEDNKAKAAAEAVQKKAVEALNAANQANQKSLKPFRTVAFSADGGSFATAGDDALVQTWDSTKGRALQAFAGHQGPIVAVAVSGEAIVSASADKTSVVWDAHPDWKLVARLGASAEDPLDVSASPFVNRVLALDFSPNGKLLATGGGDPSRAGELMIWDVEKRAIVHNLKDAHSDTVFGVEFSPTGDRLASGAADKFVKLHTVADGRYVRSYEGHTHHVLDVAWKADESEIASAGADNAVKIWNVETGEQKQTFTPHTKQITSIQYIGTGQNVVTAGGDKTIRFSTSSNRQNYRNFTTGTDFMYAAAASRDEEVVVAGGADGVLRVWDGGQRGGSKQLFAFEPPKPPEPKAQASAAQ